MGLKGLQTLNQALQVILRQLYPGAIAVIIPLALLKTVSTFIFYIRWDSFTLAFLFFIILLFS